MMMHASPADITCLLIADDLTGACDGAVHFAARGHRTIVSYPDTFRAAAVSAVSTESRDWNGDEIRSLMSCLASRLPVRSAGLIFKKIDSTLRGNGGLEILAALDAFACDAAIVTPALPTMRRLVESGILRVEGDTNFQPIEVNAWLRVQGVKSCESASFGRIAEAVSSGIRVVTLDAAEDAGPDCIAA